MNDETKLFVGIIVATVAIIGGAMFFLSKPGTGRKPVDAKILIRNDSEKISTSSATVTLVEFGDYQCPACGAYYPIVKQLLVKYKDSITYVFRDFPLPAHTNAPLAAQAAHAAGKQSKFWEMHNTLYEKQPEWSVGAGTDARKFILGYAKDIGLDVDQFTKDLDSSEIKNIIDREVQDGNVLGINSTPSYFINNVKIENPASLADFEALIKAEITKVK